MQALAARFVLPITDNGRFILPPQTLFVLITEESKQQNYHLQYFPLRSRSVFIVASARHQRKAAAGVSAPWFFSSRVGEAF